MIQAPALSIIGAEVDPFSLVNTIASMSANGMSISGGNITFIQNATAAVLFSNMNNSYYQLTSGGGVTATFDSAYNIGKILPGPLTIGQSFTFQAACIGATNFGGPSLSDAALNVLGNSTVLAQSSRMMVGFVTQVNSTVGMAVTAGTTFGGLSNISGTNNAQITLVGNTIVPVLGTLIYLNVIPTTGSGLPSGWYPINSVTSATQFNIATPYVRNWTAFLSTTIGTSIVAPSTYSPLISLQSIWYLQGVVGV